uniref:G_PROTEIN_RECEP_F1_2 domain-containing protein n=1 Tax=Haemonchus contortus TaxID=6289 RepID=A0A7I4YPA2_HAECO
MQEWDPISEAVSNLIRQYVPLDIAQMIAGAIGSLLNVQLLCVLVSVQKLRRDAKYLICLAWGDLSNCLSFFLLGFYRYRLYTYCLAVNMVPVETPLSCVKKPNVWFRIIGNVWPPTVLILMGTERMLGVLIPIFFRQHLRDKSTFFCIASVVVTVTVCMIGLFLSIHNGSKKVKFDCGRKATFSDDFTIAIYCWEVFGYICAFVMNLIAFLRLRAIANLRISKPLREW